MKKTTEKNKIKLAVKDAPETEHMWYVFDINKNSFLSIILSFARILICSSS